MRGLGCVRGCRSSNAFGAMVYWNVRAIRFELNVFVLNPTKRFNDVLNQTFCGQHDDDDDDGDGVRASFDCVTFSIHVFRAETVLNHLIRKRRSRFDKCVWVDDCD